MKKLSVTLLTFLLLASSLPFASAQDTFSIVAVDEATGEVGSAGASCVTNAGAFGGVILLSGILPGRGGINAQANICIPHTNLQIGLDQMNLGLSPEEIIQYLIANDGCQFGNFTNRQYGIADFDGNGAPRSAAYTGTNCLDHAGHRTGPGYAIQGNILLGPAILDSMEARFLNTPGPLAKRLMAAMQGANVPGADTRCMLAGTSSTSAFLRVAKPSDAPGNFYLDLNVAETPFGVEPIDSLQALFDAWMATINNTGEVAGQTLARVFPNPSGGEVTLDWLVSSKENTFAVLTDISGKRLLRQPVRPGRNTVVLPQTVAGHVLLLHVENEAGRILFSEKIIARKE